MDDRQAYALAHPLNSADPTVHDIARYRTVKHTPDGLLVVVLAVDR